MKKVKCECPACNTVQLVEYSPILSKTMECIKCGAEFQAVTAKPKRPKPQKDRVQGMQKPFVICKDCGRQISSKAERCPSCGAPTAATRAKRHIRQHIKRRKKWCVELFAAVLIIAATSVIVGLGFVHVISGSNLTSRRIVLKDSFGYGETFIDIDKITGMPWVFAKAKYPIGCKVLQDRGHIETDEEFLRRIKRQFARLHE